MSKETLGINNNVSDALFQTTFDDLFSSSWGYRGYKTRPDFSRQRIDITPDNTGVSYGGTLRFTIPKRAAILRRLSFAVSVAALGGPTNPRFVDFAAFRLLERTLMRYGANEIQDIRPLQHYVETRMDYRRKDQEAIARLAGGDLSAAERITAAAARQDWIVHIPFHFSETPDKCIFLEGLGFPIEIDITLAALADISTGQTATAVSGGALTNIRLVAELVHIEDYERDFHIERTLDEVGLLQSVRDFRFQPASSITAAAAVFDYPLTNLKGSCYSIRYITQDITEANSSTTGGATATTDDKDFFNFLTWTATADDTWILQASGINVVDPMTQQWNIDVENRDLHSGDPGDLIYGYDFTYQPEDKRNCTGHKTWAGMTNPTIQLRAGGAGFPANLQIIGISREYNATHTIQGDLIKVFK